MTTRMTPAFLAAILSIAVLAPAEAQQRRVAPATQSLLTVSADLPASCRIVDRFGASRTREFGAPATIDLQPRQAGDAVVCVHDGKESRAAVSERDRQVAVPVSAATAAATPVGRFVTVAEVHPDPARLRLKPEVERDLVFLRQRYEEGRLSERDYFKFRRAVIASNEAGPAPRAARRAAPANRAS